MLEREIRQGYSSNARFWNAMVRTDETTSRLHPVDTSQEVNRETGESRETRVHPFATFAVIRLSKSRQQGDAALLVKFTNLFPVDAVGLFGRKDPLIVGKTTILGSSAGTDQPAATGLFG